MDTLSWVVMTCAVVWLGLGAYVTFVAVQQKKLRQRLEQLEILDND